MRALAGIIAMVSGAALLYSLSLDWYGVSAPTPLGTASGAQSAYEAFEWTDRLLVFAGIVAIASGLALAAAPLAPGLVRPAALALRAAGFVGAGVVIARAASAPLDAVALSGAAEVTRESGILVAFSAAAGIVCAGYATLGLRLRRRAPA